MAGSAAFTTVPSRNETPEPSTAAAMTQRPAAVPVRSPGELMRAVKHAPGRIRRWPGP